MTKATDSPPSTPRFRTDLDCRALHVAAYLLVTAVSVERRLARGLKSHTSR